MGNLVFYKVLLHALIHLSIAKHVLHANIGSHSNCSKLGIYEYYNPENYISDVLSMTYGHFVESYIG